MCPKVLKYYPCFITLDLVSERLFRLFLLIENGADHLVLLMSESETGSVSDDR